jgi:LPXTG-site transpeptidase (sortase) family protein
MATIAPRAGASASPPAAAPTGGGQQPAQPPTQPPTRGSAALRRVGATVSVAALLFVGLFVYLYGLSGVSEAHAQSTLFKTFAPALAQAIAPVGPTREGAPVAVLNIAAIGLRNAVVVEGTTSRDLTLGPGHVRASALPGEAGWSFIYGKRATFGAPFAHLMQLRTGDVITVATGQGVAKYVVHSFGTSKYPAVDTSADRLILMTANSANIPTEAVQVSADLVSTPQANPGTWPGITPQEQYLASDTGSLVPLFLWSEALLAAVIAATVAAHRWSRWPTYLLAAPVVIAVTVNVYQNVAGLLPNLY